MGKRKGGSRRGTRSKLSKNARQKGKISITRYFQKLAVGDRVILKADPSVHKGLYFSRYHGKAGTIKGKRGSCYEVLINDLGKEKKLMVHPVHLKKA